MEEDKAIQLSAEAAAFLQEGIGLLFSKWSALEMAVVNEWGGRDSRLKSQQLAADVFSWFTQSKEPLYIDDLEAILDESMVSLFNTEVEDNSVEEIAEKLMIMHEECLQGNFKLIKALKEDNHPRGVVPHIKQAGSDDDNDDESNDESIGDKDLSEMAVYIPGPQSNLNQSDMMVDEPVTKPKAVAEAEEDGWTVVGPRRNRGRRN